MRQMRRVDDSSQLLKGEEEMAEEGLSYHPPHPLPELSAQLASTNFIMFSQGFFCKRCGVKYELARTFNAPKAYLLIGFFVKP